MVEISPLVLVALAPDELGVEVDPIGPLELAALDGQLERRQVRAGQERVELGRREDETVRPLMHLNTLARTQEAISLHERWHWAVLPTFIPSQRCKNGLSKPF